MADLALRFEKDIVVLDGAMGSLILAEGIDSDFHQMLLNVLEPELIQSIHQRYLLAGAQALTSNSFSGSRSQLEAHGLADRVEELNRAAVCLAKAMRPQHVLADVGPCGLLMPPFGNSSFAEVFDIYAEQISALAAEQPDAILIETMIDIADARCALLAAKSVTNLPVLVSVSLAANNRMELSATDAATAAVILEAAGADVVGLNCGLGPEFYLQPLASMAAVSDLPLLVQPNAGLPELSADGRTVYSGTTDQMAEAAWAYRQLGAQLIGSCCGSTPSHTAAIFATVSGLDAIKPSRVANNALPDSARSSQSPVPAIAKQPLRMVLASPTGLVEILSDGPCRIIGERINPSGKEQLTSELAAGDLALASSLCIDQVAAGAELIDVNVGAKEVDTRAVFPALTSELASFCKAPLVLDCWNAEALEAALRIYPGRALINSVSGSESSLERILPMAKQYGAAVIALCVSGREMPESVEEIIAIAEQIRAAAHAVGLTDNDLLFDAVAPAAVAHPDALELAVATVAEMTARGWLSVLAISNISFKMDNRSALNAGFVSAAIEAGLNAAFINPNDELVMTAAQAANVARAQQQQAHLESLA